MAASLSCQALQTRLEGANLAIRKAASKEAVAKARAERDRLSAQYQQHCTSHKGGKTGTQATMTLPFPAETAWQADTPEEECQRRREAINRKGRQAEGAPGGMKRRQGGSEITETRAIPVEGFIRLEGGSSSSFYGKVRQEITYTIQETFVGNLIVTRSGGREEYALQTLSTEIDVDRFSGRGCAKYTGSPPVCSRWHALDLWQIADGEEYPGKADGVVSLTSDGRALTFRIAPPDIDFGSSEGPVSVRTGCGQSFRETVNRDEFKQWLRRSTVRIKREIGKTTPGCRPGSTLTLEMHIGSGL